MAFVTNISSAKYRDVRRAMVRGRIITPYKSNYDMKLYTGTPVFLSTLELNEVTLIVMIYKYEGTGRYHMIDVNELKDEETVGIFGEMAAEGHPINYQDIMAMIKL